jgi:hypothetical protein
MEDDIPNAEIENADSEVIEPDEKVLEESLNLVINTKENEES